MNYIYSKIIVSCQRRCLTFENEKVREPEVECLLKCANEYMFLDNFLFETDTATQIASNENKIKKANFYISRRVDDLTLV